MMNRSHRLRTRVDTGNNAVTKSCPKPVFQAPDGLLLLVTKPRPKQRYYYIGAGQAERFVISPTRRQATADEQGPAVGSARLSAALLQTCIPQRHHLAPDAAGSIGAHWTCNWAPLGSLGHHKNSSVGPLGVSEPKGAGLSPRFRRS